jgi:hypothetical protein
MVGGYHLFIQNETFCNCFKWDWKRLELTGRNGEDDLTNIQYKPIWNCHNEFPLYNEYKSNKNCKKK